MEKLPVYEKKYSQNIWGNSLRFLRSYVTYFINKNKQGMLEFFNSNQINTCGQFVNKSKLSDKYETNFPKLNFSSAVSWTYSSSYVLLIFLEL